MIKILKECCTFTRSENGIFWGIGVDVGGFFKKQQAEAAASHWQLIQLAPTERPGRSCNIVQSVHLYNTAFTNMAK